MQHNICSLELSYRGADEKSNKHMLTDMRRKYYEGKRKTICAAPSVHREEYPPKLANRSLRETAGTPKTICDSTKEGI